MTIKELEALVDMTRANIRFYEQQGLLSPERLPNGYRDYSQEDADALRKIKLFRQLHLDLDTIRKLQSGELPLSQALSLQLNALEADQAALDRAKQVCQALRESGTSYAALDPKPWLDELARPPVPASPRYAPPADREPPQSALHPWRRYFARRIDMFACMLIPLAIAYLGFHWKMPTGPFATWLMSYVNWAFLFLMEPLCLHFWGTTPGKAIFGITIHNGKGEKLTWKEAFNRTWQVFAHGDGYCIPFYDLWRLWKCYKACQNGERQPWESGYMEDAWNDWEQYRFADGKTWRCWACVGAFAVYVGLAALIIFQSMMPPNRGDLTVTEFCENYNFYMDYLEVDGKRLNETAQWVDNTPPGTFTIDVLEGMEYTFDFTLSGETVTGVSLIQTGETDGLLWYSYTHQQIALLALAGSMPQLNCITFRARDWVKLPEQQQDWNYELTFRGLQISQTTYLTGFEFQDSPNSILAAKDGQTAHFAQEFRISFAE